MELNAVDDEPAWRDAARFATKIWRHPKTHSTLFICSCTCALTAAAFYSGTYFTPTVDVIVYCFIYSLWLTICLPWLVKNLDKKTVLLVVGVLFRLFAAEVGVLTWGLLRGHGHFLQRALRLKPLLEPSLLWLAEAGYNLRYGVIVSAVVTATLVTLTSAIQDYSRGGRSDHISSDKFGNEGLLPFAINYSRNPSSHAQFKKTNQESHSYNAFGQVESVSDRQTLPTRDMELPSSISHWYCKGCFHSPAINLTKHELTSGRNSSPPHLGKILSQNDKIMTKRNNKNDRAPRKTQQCPPRVVDKVIDRGCKDQYGELWDGFSSFDSLSNAESFSMKDGERDNQDQNVALRESDFLKVNCRGYGPRGASEISSISLLPDNAGLLGASRAKAKVKPSSSYASSVTSDEEFVKRKKQTSIQRSGRNSCPTDLKFSPENLIDRKTTREKRSSRRSEMRKSSSGPRAATDGQSAKD